MWTAANRARMAAIEKKTRRYPTDLTDEEWSQVEGLLPKPRKTGRRRGVDLREVLNGIRYLARTGCGWRMLPVNFPPWPDRVLVVSPFRPIVPVPHDPRSCPHG